MHIEPWKSPPGERRAHLLFRNQPIPVLTRGRRLRYRHLADPVGQLFAVDCSFADGIGDDALMEMPCDDHSMAAQKNFGIDRRAPEYLLRIARVAFCRVELTPDRGMDAVSADQDIR